jgi:hypothetical protein
MPNDADVLQSLLTVIRDSFQQLQHSLEQVVDAARAGRIKTLRLS